MSWHSLCIHDCKISKHSRLHSPEICWSRSSVQNTKINHVHYQHLKTPIFAFSTNSDLNTFLVIMVAYALQGLLTYEKFATSNISCLLFQLWTCLFSFYWLKMHKCLDKFSLSVLTLLPHAWKHLNCLCKMYFSFLAIVEKKLNNFVYVPKEHYKILWIHFDT